MEISLNKRCDKELVVALELSESQRFVLEIFEWAMENLKEIQVTRCVQWQFFDHSWSTIFLILDLISETVPYEELTTPRPKDRPPLRF